MNKKYFVIFALSLIFSCVSACGLQPIDALEYYQICSEVNKDSPIQAKGYLYVAEKVPCLKSINTQRDCAVKLLENINVVNDEVILDLPEGKGKNQLETPEAENPTRPTSVFSRDQVKIRFDDDSSMLQSSETAIPVIVEGTVRIPKPDEWKKCKIEVTKIEKGS